MIDERCLLRWCCHRRCTSCLACWRCCYFVLLPTLLLLLAVRLLSCAQAPTYIHTYMHYYHSRIARLAPKVEGRSPSAMALFITVSMPADGRAHRDETRGGTILISMLQQLPHHSRIICTRKYTTVARTCKPRLICLWPSAATITTMTTRRTPAASNVGQGCVTTGVCHGTRSDTIRSDQRDSALGEDLFPALLCYT